MSATLTILLVRPWTLDPARIRTSLRASGLAVRLLNVDFPAALSAALGREAYDAIIFDPHTPGLSQDTLYACMREHAVSTPVIVLRDGQDVGEAVATALRTLRN